MQVFFSYVIRFYLYICCLNCLCLFHDLILVGIKSCSVNRKGKSSITWKQVRFFIISFLQRNVAQGEVTFVSFEMMFFFFQVQGWFQGSLEKQNQPKFKTAPSSPLLIVDLSNPGGVRDAGSPETVTYGQRVKG